MPDYPMLPVIINSRARFENNFIKNYIYYYLWRLAARLRLRIFFLRHFHRCLPRFFQALELRFIQIPLYWVLISDNIILFKYIYFEMAENHC